jgi:hypothetical protein
MQMIIVSFVVGIIGGWVLRWYLHDKAGVM